MDVKEAVRKAKSYLTDLFGAEGIEDLLLEEVQFDDDGDWLITVSFVRPFKRDGFLAKAGLERPRAYKVVQISRQEDDVISVKDRQLFAA